MKNFWKKLKKPLFALAPMEDVTDSAFRRIIAKYGKPDVFFTEFTSCDALCSREGYEASIHNLWYTKNEHPIVAQIFGANPEHFFRTAEIVRGLGFDGIDINMGCPVKKIVANETCAALIQNPTLAQEIIAATKEGACGLPVSVKTRIGWEKDQIEAWIPTLLACAPAVITVHGRTRKQMSRVPADWDAISRCVKIRDESGKDTLIIGNGDVKTLSQAREYAQRFGVDGVMLGRAIFGNPWLFNKRKKKIDIGEKLDILVEHTKLFEKLLTGRKPFATMKKHYKAYVNGWHGAKSLRVKLMAAHNAQEVEECIRRYQKEAKENLRNLISSL